MLCVIPYCRRDQHLTKALLAWIAEMGMVSGRHDLLLVPDEDVDYADDLAVGKSCFKSAIVNPIDRCTAPWPFSQNHVWKRTVDYVDHFKMGPFLFLENDAVPLVPDWLNRIEDEYRACGKPFMGYLEYRTDPERRHMNGVGVYVDVHDNAPSLLSAPTPSDPTMVGQNHMAWDWAGKDEVVPRMHVTRLIQFQYKKEDMLLQDESLAWLDPEAVLFHTCKNPRLIELLRARRNGVRLPVIKPEWKVLHERQAAKFSEPSLRRIEDCTKDELRSAATAVGMGFESRTYNAMPFTTDIYIKTYAKVADWHVWAMKSIEKYCTGFRRTLVVGDQPSEGYQQMQVMKLTADRQTDADFILFTDSDCIFALPVTPETYMRDGKPIWLHRSWGAAVKQEGDTVLKWQRGMRKFFGIEPPREFMCRHPEMIPRWLLSAFRLFCQTRHGMTMEQWVLADHEFADWNMLGMYAWLYHRECFHWIDQDAETPPTITVKQYWGGHTPIEPHIAEIEAIIAGGAEIVHTTNSGPKVLDLNKPIFRVENFAKGIFPKGAGCTVRPSKKPKKRAKKKRTPEVQAKIDARMAALRARRTAAA